ncbi:MAG TPA: hypothetical protein VHB70_10125 [Parafilimonas sp.]|nr:hypothetical protein [Parafilimonas sp.]
MKKLFLFFFLYSAFCSVNAQSFTKSDIPLVRLYFHEKIDSTQKQIAKYDGIPDSLFTPSDNDDLNKRINDALTVQVDDLQNEIEASKLSENNDKIRYLRGLNECLQRFLNGYRFQTIKSPALIEIVSGYKKCLELDEKKESILPVIKTLSYDAGDILVNSVSFDGNEGIDASKDVLVLKVCHDHPERMMMVLSQHPDMPFVDSLVVVAARRQPDELYTYAAAYDKLAQRIRSNPDSLVQLISKLSQMPSGRLYFPFLDNLMSGKVTFDDIGTALRDSTKYYSLLVKTEIDYADRVRRRDTPISMAALQSKLADKAKEVYVNTINGLHESPDNVRFRCIQKLSPEELYYLAVMTDDVIYTSSYVNGVYPRIWQQMKSPRGDSLLMLVRFDHFKKWIKIAANYNTLDDFLKRMDKGNAEILMKAFVNKLDQTSSLEDAVDVADSYASINDKNIHNLILNQVKYNLSQAEQSGNKRAISIYKILNTLFLSLDSSNHVDVASTLGIPPVYFMPNKSMRNDSGRIIIQQFFYGDKDGNNVFNAFINSFRNSNWRITSNDKWVTVSSTRGVPISIYSNRPLDDETSKDEEAQLALGDYLVDNNLYPSMVIHRGHSYYLPSTLEQLDTSAKLVLLGSCGAYQHLNKVLSTCPTAQIISSRQTGSGTINGPMINIIVEQLRQGKNLDWPVLWRTIGKQVSHKEYFDDYVPPYKNLGAVFIMAYQKQQMNQED